MTKKEQLIQRLIQRFPGGATIKQVEEFLDGNKVAGKLYDDLYGEKIGGIASLMRSMKRAKIARNRL